LNDCVDVGDSILGGCTAGATVLHLILIAALVESALKCVGPGLTRLKAVSSCDAVSKADDRGAITGEQGISREDKQKRDEKPTLYVHTISVKVCKGRNVVQAGCVRMKEPGEEGLTG
jgi:hypothetical protein